MGCVIRNLLPSRIEYLGQLLPARYSRCTSGLLACLSPHRTCGHRTCAILLYSSVYLIMTCPSAVELFAMAPNVDGIWYYVSATFSLAALLSTSTSNPKIVSKVCLTRFPVFLIPETKGWVSFFYACPVGHG